MNGAGDSHPHFPLVQVVPLEGVRLNQISLSCCSQRDRRAGIHAGGQSSSHETAAGDYPRPRIAHHEGSPRETPAGDRHRRDLDRLEDLDADRLGTHGPSRVRHLEAIIAVILRGDLGDAERVA